MFARTATWTTMVLLGSLAICLPLNVLSKTEAITVDPDLALREEMVAISRQLGVTCTHCHDAKNFKSQTLPTFAIAKEHMRVVGWLNSKQGFAGKPRVDCFMCHRGEAKPPFQEALAAGTEKTKSAAHGTDHSAKKAEKH